MLDTQASILTTTEGRTILLGEHRRAPRDDVLADTVYAAYIANFNVNQRSTHDGLILAAPDLQ